MPRPEPSSDYQTFEDTRPLLSAHDEDPLTGTHPTATTKSPLTRSLHAAYHAIRGFRRRPDLTSVIQGMETWGKPESTLAPTEIQVRHSLCNYLGYHDPKCWPPGDTREIVEIPITTFIQVSAQDELSRLQLKKQLKHFKKIKDDWDTYMRESIYVHKRKHLGKIQFTDDPEHDKLIEDFVSTIVRGIKRRFEEGRGAQEQQPELGSSREHVSGVGSQVHEGVVDSRDSLSQLGDSDTPDVLSVWSQA